MKTKLFPMQIIRRIFGLFVAFSAMTASVIADPLPLIENNKSNYTIVVPVDAPASVQQAAEELQRCLAIATGVSLSMVQDDAGVMENVISIGHTINAEEAQVSSEGVAAEGFRIITKNGSLFIIGDDTPAGQRTKDGGVSNGTANGVYSFLEKYAGVRWLLPGNSGRDVPVQKTLVLDEINHSEAPWFINRRLPYTALTGKNKPEIGLWHRRQRMGYSFRIEHGHNWAETVPSGLWKERPDWFPMINGERPQPQGHMYKLETTNPEVVERFAQRAVNVLTKNPERNTFSLSPSDGYGWSQSPESLALMEKDPLGKQSVTPLILKFYNDVAKVVAVENPDLKLAGYVYNDYLYPPNSGNVQLPDNFYPVLAASVSYGYRLIRPEARERYVYLLQEWSKVTPHLFYYDLPNTFVPWTRGHGTIAPTTPEMLNFMFKHLTENNVKGLYIYGDVDWGYGALSNYLWAKLMWNPQQDAYELQKEWLYRAYGEEAGVVMNRLYVDLEKWFTEFYTQNSPHGHYNAALLKGFYGVRYPEIEKYILEAREKPMNQAQRKRFELIENNVIVLQYRLRRDKILPAKYQSLLTRSDEEITRILTTDSPDYNLFPNHTALLPKS